MNKIYIEPNKGIGKILLGMNKKTVHNIMKEKPYVHDINVESYDSIPLKVAYDLNNKVEFLELSNHNKEVILKGIDVFKTKANKLLEYLKPYSEIIDEELGHSYFLKDLRVEFYRSGVLTEEMMENEDFKSLGKEIQKDEMKYLYFECISIATKEYYAKNQI